MTAWLIMRNRVLYLFTDLQTSVHMLRGVAEEEAQPGLTFKIVERGVQWSNGTYKTPTQQQLVFVPAWIAKPTRKVEETAGRVGSQMSYTGLPASSVQLRNRLCIWKKQHATCIPEDGSTTKTISEQQESFMLKHQNEQHGQREIDFEATIISCFKDCLTRQISEGVHIRRSE